MRSTIIRNNRNFLKEVIDPDKIIFQMESCGCLTEDQIKCLNLLGNHKDKNHELLLMLQDSSYHKYSKFVDRLFETNQTPAALVLERGGETVKMQVSNGKATWTRQFGKELINRFQRMQTENMLILNDLLNVSVDKRLNDVFILHAKQKQNKGIELWFWCKTEISLNQLKSFSNDALREIIQRMFQRLIPEHKNTIEPQTIQNEFTLAGDFAERRLSIRQLGDRRTLTRVRFSQCVTSLADNIYVAKSEWLLVYKNKNPFRSLKSIELGRGVLPTSSAACNINKCLYLCVQVNCIYFIYKVEPEFDNKVTAWLTENSSFIISVTSRGDVLVLHIGHMPNKLQMITHEGTVKCTISMESRFNHTQFIQEIMPDIVALNIAKAGEFCPGCISIMRLDENGTILHNIDCQEAIVGLSSFRYGDLLIGVFDYENAGVRDDSRASFSLTNNTFHDRYVKLQHWTLKSKVARDFIKTDRRLTSIHFAADKKQLYVLHSDRLDIYQVKYEDEDWHR